MTHEITVKVPDSKLDLFELMLSELNLSAKLPKRKAKKKLDINNLNADQKWFVDTMTAALHQVKLAEAGLIDLPDAFDALDEIDAENARENPTESEYEDSLLVLENQ